MADIYQIARKLERHLKGLAHHKRIHILLILKKYDSGLTLEDLVEETKLSQTNASHHTSILSRAGLVDKKYQKRYVLHKLSPYGKKFVTFLLTLSHI